MLDDLQRFRSFLQDIITFLMKEGIPSGPVVGEVDILPLRCVGVVVKPFPDFLELGVIHAHIFEYMAHT